MRGGATEKKFWQIAVCSFFVLCTLYMGTPGRWIRWSSTICMSHRWFAPWCMDHRGEMRERNSLVFFLLLSPHTPHHWSNSPLVFITLPPSPPPRSINRFSDRFKNSSTSTQDRSSIAKGSSSIAQKKAAAAAKHNTSQNARPFAAGEMHIGCLVVRKVLMNRVDSVGQALTASTPSKKTQNTALGDWPDRGRVSPHAGRGGQQEGH